MTEKKEVKQKTSILSSKIFIAVSIVGLIGFVAVVGLVISIFYEQPQTLSNSSSLITDNARRGDPLITVVAIKPEINGLDPIRGLKDAPVTIVEFGDFECPYCSVMKDILKDVLRAYPEKVSLVWKDYPLTDTHYNAYEAAIAARCAQRQEKFWEMHDLLLGGNLNSGSYTDYAKELNLNIDDFDQCVDSKETAALVDDGIKQGQDLFIEATPHFYINDQEISGTATVDDFKKLIEIELGK
ncbi:MAG: hypothetical protein COY66_02730 [Candidatus Kerfeldbacteria bacterium CG_4_10_14_0_8_um_filter_42_10]|uniref:Thioredoxin domain-containing protein n=1 Tax=Candidatus Kerfeldbacteria bacterium CG_4_10_14_0_8_um_filter_42_10 TaxID=2014248 RepID=A0A2M7RJ87_9BACT|nr:MAG: hypothetical protein COY66_02730 [Candidatus Kerfeldbacteria bacterium CG_4_10_14_0_8_um_filter_42_10]